MLVSVNARNRISQNKIDKSIYYFSNISKAGGYFSASYVLEDS